MGRRSSHLHFATGPKDEATHRTPLACDASGYSWNYSTTDVAKVTCPKCSAIVSKQRLAELAEAGTVLALASMGDMPGNHGYRYAYRAMLNGQAVGVVGFDGAYAAGAWYVMPLVSMYAGSNVVDAAEAEDQHHTTMLTGCKLTADPNARYPRELSFASKEAALAAVADLVAAGRLHDATNEAERSRGIQARVLANRAARQRERNAEREGFESVVRGLTSLRNRLSDLTNEEADALETAMAAYQRRVADPSDF